MAEDLVAGANEESLRNTYEMSMTGHAPGTQEHD